MNCTQAQELFDTYLDGELTGSLATEFAAHKLQCPACRRELALLEVTGHIVAADTASPSLGAEFTDRLLGCALAAPRPWYRRQARLLKIGGPLTAAACLVLIFTVAFSGPSAPHDGEPTDPTVVAGEREQVESPEQLLEHIDRALVMHPDDPGLQALAEQLRSRLEEIAAGTKDGAVALENYSRMEIINILKSIPIDDPQASAEQAAEAPAGGDADDPTSADHP